MISKIGVQMAGGKYKSIHRTQENKRVMDVNCNKGDLGVWTKIPS